MCKTPYVVKPILPSFGSSVADSLSNVPDIWFNTDGAIGVDVLSRLQPLCCGRGLLSLVLRTFSRDLIKHIGTNRLAS